MQQWQETRLVCCRKWKRVRIVKPHFVNQCRLIVELICLPSKAEYAAQLLCWHPLHSNEQAAVVARSAGPLFDFDPGRSFLRACFSILGSVRRQHSRLLKFQRPLPCPFVDFLKKGESRTLLKRGLRPTTCQLKDRFDSPLRRKEWRRQRSRQLERLLDSLVILQREFVDIRQVLHPDKIGTERKGI